MITTTTKYNISTNIDNSLIRNKPKHVNVAPPPQKLTTHLTTNA